jgi:hypothetical protein
MQGGRHAPLLHLHNNTTPDGTTTTDNDDDDDALPFDCAPFCLVVGHARLASLPRPHTLPRTTTSSTSIIIITQQQQASKHA